MIFLGRNRHLLFQHFVAFSCPIYNTTKFEALHDWLFVLTNAQLYLLKKDTKRQPTAYLDVSYPSTQAGHGCFNASKVVPLRCHWTSTTLTCFQDGVAFPIALRPWCSFFFAHADYLLLFFGSYPLFAGNLNTGCAFKIRHVQYTCLLLTVLIKNVVYFRGSLWII